MLNLYFFTYWPYTSGKWVSSHEMQPSVSFMYTHMIWFKVSPKVDVLLCNLKNLVQIFPRYERQEYMT